GRNNGIPVFLRKQVEAHRRHDGGRYRDGVGSMMRNLFASATAGARVRTSTGRPARGGKRLGGSVALLLFAFALLPAFVASPGSGQLATDSAPQDSLAAAAGVDPLAAAGVAPVMQPAPDETETVYLPRSMRVYWHVFGAFGLAWLLI